jgi:hypothetical protein
LNYTRTMNRPSAMDRLAPNRRWRLKSDGSDST